MRRKDREINDEARLRSILEESSVLRIAIHDDPAPYILPLLFVYEENSLYFHSARKGKKIDLLKKNQVISFEVDLLNELVPDENPCQWSLEFSSIIGYGKVSFIEDTDTMARVLNLLMKKHRGGSNHTFCTSSLKGVVVIGVEILEMTGKGWKRT